MAFLLPLLLLLLLLLMWSHSHHPQCCFFRPHWKVEKDVVEFFALFSILTRTIILHPLRIFKGPLETFPLSSSQSIPEGESQGTTE